MHGDKEMESPYFSENCFEAGGKNIFFLFKKTVPGTFYEQSLFFFQRDYSRNCFLECNHRKINRNKLAMSLSISQY